ncbi:MAG: hypothetical protein F4156_09855 [Holophagales bacterium]|nr:hypothetical protein [Holophagales bacterium]
MEMQLDFTGFEETIKAMTALPALTATQVYGDGMLGAAKVVRDEARGTVALGDRTGRLRASIKVRRQASRVHTSRGLRKIPGSAAQVLAGGEAARQAFYIEYGRATGPGHSGAAPQPFLEPALISTTSRQLTAAGAAMKKSFAARAPKITSSRTTRRTLRPVAEDL